MGNKTETEVKAQQESATPSGVKQFTFTLGQVHNLLTNVINTTEVDKNGQQVVVSKLQKESGGRHFEYSGQERYRLMRFSKWLSERGKEIEEERNRLMSITPEEESKMTKTKDAQWREFMEQDVVYEGIPVSGSEDFFGRVPLGFDVIGQLNGVISLD